MVWSSLGLGGDVGSVEKILNLSCDHHLHVHVMVHCQTEKIQHKLAKLQKLSEIAKTVGVVALVYTSYLGFTKIASNETCSKSTNKFEATPLPSQLHCQLTEFQ